MENLKHKGFSLGEPIKIYHFDTNGKEIVTRLPPQLKGREKLYKIMIP